jgi:hypothetical protein
VRADADILIGIPRPRLAYNERRPRERFGRAEPRERAPGASPADVSDPGDAMNRTAALQAIARRTQAKTYLEIGVNDGRNFLAIDVRRKIAVDPVEGISTRRKWDGCRAHLWNVFNDYRRMTSDEFFATRSRTIEKRGLDLAFIDGLHTYDQSLRDVRHCLRHLNDGGVIVLHDCSPPTPAAGHPAQSWKHAKSLRLPGWTKAWCGDVWKTIVYLRSTRADLSVFVLDDDFGIGIITRGVPDNMLSLTPDAIDGLTYADLDADRTHLLNLKDLDEFEGFLTDLTLRPAG